MSLLNKVILGHSELLPKEEIIKYLENSKNFDSQHEILGEAEALLIFETKRQHTWLVTTSERLYCTLDDVERGGPHINWSIPKSKVVSGNSIQLELDARDKSPRAGLIDLGEQHKNWLYTKSLFSSKNIIDSVSELIGTKML